jgi:AcrR family transcriptional regulator
MTGRRSDVKCRHMAKSDPDLFRRQTYHHGNLREALVGAARDLIAERGPAGFTLVEAARRAGVSAAAPYRHFKDRDALVAEVRRRGFEEFGRRLSDAWAGAEADLNDAFGRMGRAYLTFAHEEPGYYSAMFAPGPMRSPNPPSEAARNTFAALRAAIAQLVGKGRRDSDGLDLLAYEVWALTHGIAMLAGAGFFTSGSKVPLASEILEAGVGALIAGAAAKAPARSTSKGPRGAKVSRTRHALATSTDRS